jgi:hypothetical protein
VNCLVNEFFITVQFRRNKGNFGGKDYVYKLISPMYLGKHDELLILKDPVNEKGYSYNTEMLVTGVFDDYEAYQKYCKLKNVFVCAYEDILFLQYFKIKYSDDIDLVYEHQNKTGTIDYPKICIVQKDGKKLTIMAWRPEDQDILITHDQIDKLITDKMAKCSPCVHSDCCVEDCDNCSKSYPIASFAYSPKGGHGELGPIDVNQPSLKVKTDGIVTTSAIGLHDATSLTNLTDNDLLNAQLQSYDADKYVLKPNKTGSVAINADWLHGMINGLMDQADKEVIDAFNTKEKEKESKMDFSKILNIDFGKVPHTAELKPSIYGVAVLGFDNRYRAYDKINDKVMDVTGMTFDTDMLFKIPVAVSQVRVGDVIINASNYVTVTNVHPDGTFTVVDPKASEQKIAIPAKNMFGFDFVTKIMYPFENMVQPSDDNPFGLNPMTMMMLSDGADMDMSTILALSMMNGNSGMMDQNMLIPLMLMGNDKSGNKDGLILAMAMMNQPHPTKKIKREIQSNAFAALDSCPIPLVTDEKEAPTGVNACEDDD